MKIDCQGFELRPVLQVSKPPKLPELFRTATYQYSSDVLRIQMIRRADVYRAYRTVRNHIYQECRNAS